MEVYLAARTFKGWDKTCNKLPKFLRSTIIDTGVCHFMLIVKDSAGILRQYDFGPVGGDVHFQCPTRTHAAPQHRKKVTEDQADNKIEWTHSAETGEVRETVLDGLPSHLPIMLVGRAKDYITKDHIRQFSQTQPLVYQLCERDCRHFANDLYRFLCEDPDKTITSHFIKNQFLSKTQNQPPLIRHVHRPIIGLVQHLTAQENWQETKRRIETFRSSFTGAFCGLGLHLAVQPLHLSSSGPVTAMALAAVAASTSSLFRHSADIPKAEGKRAAGDQEQKKKAEKGFFGSALGAAQAIGFGALTVASAALTASVGSRALDLPTNAALEVGRRVGRIASSPQAISTLTNLRKGLQRNGMRKVASAGALLLPGSQSSGFISSSSGEGRSRDSKVSFRSRGASPEGRALLFPSLGSEIDGAASKNGAVTQDLSSTLSFKASDCNRNGKKNPGNDWSMRLMSSRAQEHDHGFLSIPMASRREQVDSDRNALMIAPSKRPFQLLM